LELAAAGRLTAARSMWLELPEDFRVLVLRFAVAVRQRKERIDFVAHLDSPHGEFEISPEFLSRLGHLHAVVA